MGFSAELHQRFIEQAAWTQQAQELFFTKSGLNPNSRILEVGSGTGALLSSLNAIMPVESYGIDIQYDLAAFSHQQYGTFHITCADVFDLPFPSGIFDAVVCHYFLLWISNPAAALAEMRRVTRSGGMIAALAEPDYGSQIHFPEEFADLGVKQRDALCQKGAQPDIGRQLAAVLVNNGCERVASGILGYYREEPPTPEQIHSEQKILISDIGRVVSSDSLQVLLEKDMDTRKRNTRVQFVPTFFGWGYNP